MIKFISGKGHFEISSSQLFEIRLYTKVIASFYGITQKYFSGITNATQKPPRYFRFV